MFLQLHHVLNFVRVSFQRSWPESWAESWLFGCWSCEAAREAAHEAVPNGPIRCIHDHACKLVFIIILTFVLFAEKWNSGEKIGERVRTQN
jgi:hypothetical protein